jgi:hypothetical protein
MKSIREEASKMYFITGLMGVAMMVAPWFFGYNNDNTALWTSLILGAAIVLVSGYKAIMQDTARWEYWIAGILGVAAIVAPFVLQFTALTAALWTSIIVGALVALVSGYEVIVAEPETT